MKMLTPQEFRLLMEILNAETVPACRQRITHIDEYNILLRLVERRCVERVPVDCVGGARRPITVQGRAAVSLHVSLIARGLFAS